MLIIELKNLEDFKTYAVNSVVYYKVQAFNKGYKLYTYYVLDKHNQTLYVYESREPLSYKDLQYLNLKQVLSLTIK